MQRDQLGEIVRLLRRSPERADALQNLEAVAQQFNSDLAAVAAACRGREDLHTTLIHVSGRQSSDDLKRWLWACGCAYGPETQERLATVLGIRPAPDPLHLFLHGTRASTSLLRRWDWRFPQTDLLLREAPRRISLAGTHVRRLTDVDLVVWACDPVEDPLDHWLVAAKTQLAKPGREVPGPAAVPELSGPSAPLDFPLAPPHEIVAKDQADFLAMASLDVPPAEAPLHRYLPVRVYTSGNSPEDPPDAVDAVLEALDAVGFEAVSADPPKAGSYFRKFVARAKEKLTSQQVQDRVRLAERGVELATMGRLQAEQDLVRAEAFQKIVSSLEHHSEAAIQIGSLLILKTTSRGKPQITSRTLSQRELVALEQHPEALQNPSCLLEFLGQSADSTRTLSREPFDPMYPRLDEDNDSMGKAFDD